MNDRTHRRLSTIPRVGLLVAALAGFALGGLFCGGGGDDRRQDPSAAPPASAAGGGQQMYTCSMHPQVRSPDPDAKCPICAMDLIPVPRDDHAGDEGDPPRLQLTRRAAALMQVQVHPVERRRLTVPVRVYGQLDYDETRLRTIAAWVPGRLDRLHVDFTGVAVRRGQPLVELYSPQLIAAQEEFLQTMRASRELASGGLDIVRETTRLTIAAAGDRLRLLGLDEEQIELLAQRGTVADHVTITAPIGGTVIDRLAAAGDYVAVGQPIYRLADLSRLWVQLEVYESDLQWLALGQDVDFTTQSYPGEPFRGAVAFIDPALADRSRTVRVRVDIPNPDRRLKPGMFVRGVVQTGGDRAPALVVPATALLITGERAIVYVQIVDEDRPTFEPREVVLGPRAGAWQIVREGLREQELVVTNGNFKIDAELQIRGRPSMMQPAGGPPPDHGHGALEAAAAPPDPTAPAGERIVAPVAFSQQLGRLVEANFELVRALAADDATGARQGAKKAIASLQGIAPAELGADADRRRWTDLAERMHHALDALDEAEDLPAQRRHFESFSDALTEATRTFGIVTSGAVYQAMCPMVQGRKGYWLQADRTIANPYHGASMLRCGEIVEVIADPTEQGGGRP